MIAVHASWLSFLCLKLLLWVPNINNVLKVDFVENVEVTVVFVKHVEFLSLLLSHFFLVKVQEKQSIFDIVVHFSTLFLPDPFLLPFSLHLFFLPFLLLNFSSRVNRFNFYLLALFFILLLCFTTITVIQV
jgi:hypothetical protein